MGRCWINVSYSVRSSFNFKALTSLTKEQSIATAVNHRSIFRCVVDLVYLNPTSLCYITSLLSILFPFKLLITNAQKQLLSVWTPSSGARQLGTRQKKQQQQQRRHCNNNRSGSGRRVTSASDIAVSVAPGATAAAAPNPISDRQTMDSFIYIHICSYKICGVHLNDKNTLYKFSTPGLPDNHKLPVWRTTCATRMW